MKKKIIFNMFRIFAFMIAFVFDNMAMAASSASQIISIPVSPITVFALSGNPATLAVDFSFPGFQPHDEVNVTTTYNISTNESNKKITGMLNSNMPQNTSLKVRLEAPSGATSMGDVTLSTIPSDLVTGISQVAESGKMITYTFPSSVAAGIIPMEARTVIFTLTN